MYNKQELEQLLSTLKGKVFKNINLGKLTFFKTGGCADYLFIPYDLDDLQEFLKKIPKNVPLFVIGNGSNLLVRDGGITGVTIKLSNLNNIKLNEDNTIFAESGVLDRNLAIFAANNGIQDFEFLYTIPGTVGGAVVMNAGAYSKEIKDIYLHAKVINNHGILHNLSLNATQFDYRSSFFKNNGDLIILGASFAAYNKNDKKLIQEIMNNMENKRIKTQPMASEKTAGSTFRNPLNYKAWELINGINGKELQIGGAKVSLKHSNFLINEGNATASDIENLGELIREKVKQKFNILLEWEIKIVGTHKK